MKDIILIFNQPIDKFDSYNAATRRQAPLPGGKPACGRFPRLAAFYLPPLSTERLKISMKRLAAALAAVTIAAVTLAGCAAVEEFPDETDAIPVLGDAVPEDNIDMTETSAEMTETVSETTTSTESTKTVSETEETSDTAEETYITEAETYAETEASPVIETATEAETYAETTAESGGEITKIDLTYYEVTLEDGKSSMPIVTMYPEDAPDKSEIWTSSDENVASVDGMGKITAVSEGECVIKVQSAVCPEVCAEVKVTVTAAPAAQSTSEGLTYIDGILVVNKTYALPADYNPGVDPDAQAAFDKMQADAAKEGLNIYISSGFRSYDYQAGLYDRYVQRSGKAEADRYSARAGHSEHQTGLAFDLNSIDMTFADTDECAWVNEHCAEYGFIIRYPKGSESITGYMYEPWHLRYLGTENAKKVYDSGLTLEEYLGIDSKYAE